MVDERSRAARLAVSVLFFVNGAAAANWVPRIPDVKLALDLTDGALGLALLGTGLGALGGSVAAGMIDTRIGSRNLSTIAGVCLGLVLASPGLAPSWLALTVALALLGFTDAVMDVAMNAHAVAVQQRYRRSIVNTFHALWSLGAMAGSLVGSLAAGRGVPVATHLATAGVVLAVVVIANRRFLLPTADVLVLRDGGAGAVGQRRTDRARRRGLVAPSGIVGALGLITLLAALIEDSPASWSAVYLRESLGASAGVAGLAFAAFTGAMTVARLLGDRAVEHFGAARVVRTGTLVSAVGLGGALLLASPAAAIVGFGLVGIGVAPVFPLTFATAGSLPGIPPAGAIGMVSLLARVGFLISPPVIGLIADAVGLPLALMFVVVACVGVAGSAGIVTPRAERES